MLQPVKGNHVEDCAVLVACGEHTWNDRRDIMTTFLEARGKRFIACVLGAERFCGCRWWQAGVLDMVADIVPPPGKGLWVGEGQVRFTPRKKTARTWAWRRPTLADGWETLACLAVPAAGLPAGGGLKPDDATFMLTLTEVEAEALRALFEWRAELMRAAPSARVAQIDISSIIERVNGALGYVRERGRWRVRP